MTTQEASAQPFNVRVVVGLIAAGIVAFSAFLLLSAYASDFRTSRDGRAHALSVSAVGFAGLVKLLEAVGERPRLIRSEADYQTEDLIVVAIEDRTDSELLADLLEFRGSRPTLLILPKWMTLPHPDETGWVSRLGPANTNHTAKLLSEVSEVELGQSASRQPARAAGRDFLEGLGLRAPAFARTVSGKELSPLLAVQPSGDAVIARIGERPLYLLADPDLINNHGLRDRAAARAAVAIIRQLNSTGGEGVAFDLTLNGFARKPNALKLMFEPPFLALTLALFVAALLAGLHGAFRFGPERQEGRAIAFGKSALVENSAGLIRMARREHRAGGAYAEVVREAAARAAGAAGSLAGPELDSYLDRLSKPGGPTFSELAARLRDARDRFELVGAARALFLWKKDINQ